LISKATSLKKIQEISLLAQPWKDANNKWIKVHLPVSHIYSSIPDDATKTERTLFQFTAENDLHCMPYSAHLNCMYCTAFTSLPPVTDECTKEIVAGRTLHSCTLDEVFEQSEKEIMQIIPHTTSTEVVLTKLNPSNVINNCGDSPNHVEVPEATRLLLHPGCKNIQIVDAPQVQELSSAIDVQSISSGHTHPQTDEDPTGRFGAFTFVNPKSWMDAFQVFRKAYQEINNVLHTVKNLTQQVDILFTRVENNQVHGEFRRYFHQYGHLYTLILTIIVGLVILSSFVKTLFKCCMRYATYHGQHPQQYNRGRRYSESDLARPLHYHEEAGHDNQGFRMATRPQPPVRALPAPTYNLTPAV
jgi:hypothetical protein